MTATAQEQTLINSLSLRMGQLVILKENLGYDQRTGKYAAADPDMLIHHWTIGKMRKDAKKCEKGLQDTYNSIKGGIEASHIDNREDWDRYLNNCRKYASRLTAWLDLVEGYAALYANNKEAFEKKHLEAKEEAEKQRSMPANLIGHSLGASPAPKKGSRTR